MTGAFLRRSAILCAAAALTACGNSEQSLSSAPPDPRIASLQRQLDEEKEKNRLQREYVNQATQTINGIYTRLSTIGTLETAMRKTTSDIERGEAEALPQREALLKRIDAARNELDRYAKQIATFRRRTAAYDAKIDSLEMTIDELNTRLVSKEKEISELRSALVTVRQELKEKQEEAITQQRELRETASALATRDAEVRSLHSEANTAYYVEGDAKTLIKLGIMEQKGGFLRPRTRTLAAGFDQKHFLPIDTVRDQSLMISHKPNQRMELVSPHDVHTYRLVKVNPKETRLEIIDPSAFWKIRYLVILFK